MLVVANLGSSTLNSVTLGSDANALAPGQYTPKPMLGGDSAPPFHVGSDGRVENYVPLAILERLTSYIFDRAPARR